MKEDNERQTRERVIQDLERQKALPGADKEDLQWRIDRNRLLNDPEELDERFEKARNHRTGHPARGFVEGRPGDTSIAIPAGGGPPIVNGRSAPEREEHGSVSKDLLRHAERQTQHAERQTQLLEQLVAKNQSVHVDVHPPAGSPSPRVNATRRPEPSWSTASSSATEAGEKPSLYRPPASRGEAAGGSGQNTRNGRRVCSNRDLLETCSQGGYRRASVFSTATSSSRRRGWCKLARR